MIREDDFYVGENGTNLENGNEMKEEEEEGEGENSKFLFITLFWCDERLLRLGYLNQGVVEFLLIIRTNERRKKKQQQTLMITVRFRQ